MITFVPGTKKNNYDSEELGFLKPYLSSIPRTYKKLLIFTGKSPQQNMFREKEGMFYHKVSLHNKGWSRNEE